MFKQHSRVSFCFRGLCDEWSRITKKSNFALRRLMFSFHSLTWFGSSQITQTRWRKILVAPVDWFIHFHNKQKCDLFFFSFFFSCDLMRRLLSSYGPNTGCPGKMCFPQLVGSGFWRFLAQKCADWPELLGIKAILSCFLAQATPKDLHCQSNEGREYGEV